MELMVQEKPSDNWQKKKEKEDNLQRAINVEMKASNRFNNEK